jgi:hypothetical protein
VYVYCVRSGTINKVDGKREERRGEERRGRAWLSELFTIYLFCLTGTGFTGLDSSTGGGWSRAELKERDTRKYWLKTTD